MKAIIMVQYIKYINKQVLIGEDENLYYATFSQLYQAWQNGLLQQAPEGVEPIKLLSPEGGYFFRFPFPDENIPLGEYKGVEPKRGMLLRIEPEGILTENDFLDISVKITSQTQPELSQTTQCGNPNRNAEKVVLELCQQQLIWEDGVVRLAPVLRCPFTEVVYKIRKEEKINCLLKQIFSHHQQNTEIKEGAEFWKEVIKQIKEGFELVL